MAEYAFRTLDSRKVIGTIVALHTRITERFRGAGLADVCAELLNIARASSERAERISRRNLPLRVAIALLLAAGLAGVVWIVSEMYLFPRSADSVYTVLQGMEAAANLAVLLGALLFFLVRIEERLKRRDALQALQELRSIVHVIDMHQLTKDPTLVVTVGGKTDSSPPRTLSPFEVTRYLDYCSEMVSLTSKVAVLFGQGFPDPAVAEVVSDIERIAAGLSQKIWQKIMIVQSTLPLAAVPQAAIPACAPQATAS
jgi:hypothetical protein